MIRHTVVFKFNTSLTDAEKEKFFEEANKLAAIAGVEKFECLKQVSKENMYEFGISMEFASAALYDRYSSHPDHIAFVQQYWLTCVNEFLEIDYERLN